MTTLVDIKNAILTHFLTQSSFSIPGDLASIKIDPKDSSPEFSAHKGDVARYALDEYTKSGIIAKVNDNLYALIQPINNLNQSLVLSPLTALMVANLVNDFVTHTGERKSTGYVVNMMSITDRDIQSLCHICHTLIGGSGDGEPEAPPIIEEGAN